MSELPVTLARKRAIKAIENFRINVELWKGDDNQTMRIEFAYPRLKGNINEIELGLGDVRASDGIKIYYDFERDGYVIMQPYIVEKDMGDYIDAATETWEEVGFFKSWALENKGSKIE